MEGAEEIPSGFQADALRMSDKMVDQGRFPLLYQVETFKILDLRRKRESSQLVGKFHEIFVSRD